MSNEELNGWKERISELPYEAQTKIAEALGDDVIAGEVFRRFAEKNYKLKKVTEAIQEVVK